MNRAAPLELPDFPGDLTTLVLLCRPDVVDVVRSCRGKWRGGKESRAATLAMKATEQFGHPVRPILCRLCDGFHLSSASPERAASRQQTIEVLRTALDDDQRRRLRDVWHPRKERSPLTQVSGRAVQRDERRRNPVGCMSCQRRPARENGGPLCDPCRTEVEQMCKRRVRFGSRREAVRAAEVGQASYACPMCDHYHNGPLVDDHTAIERTARSARVLREKLPEHGLRSLLRDWDPVAA